MYPSRLPCTRLHLQGAQVLAHLVLMAATDSWRLSSGKAQGTNCLASGFWGQEVAPRGLEEGLENR